MDESDQIAFTPATQTAAVSAFGLEAELQLLSDWHALTFSASRQNRPCILRLTPRSHQSPEAIAAELEWQTFVGGSGLVRVPEVLTSVRQRQWEVFKAGRTEFTAVLFERLNGRPVGHADWNASLFEDWGRLVGKLHGISQTFRPTRRRPTWNESQFLDVGKYIPDSESAIKASALAVIAQVMALPRRTQTFGIIHGDVYQDNFFIGVDGIQLFDFDLCEYGHYVSDVAVALYAALWRLPAGESREEFAALFLGAFLRGYSPEFTWTPDQRALLSLFLRLREILIYIVARKKRDLSKLSPIAKALFEERASRIAAGEPIVRIT